MAPSGWVRVAVDMELDHRWPPWQVEEIVKPDGFLD